MNLGDRVRLLHGTEEGIVIKIIDRNTVDVEIEEGFAFPVLISDLVVVAAQEESIFSDQTSTEQEETKKAISSEMGIYLGIEEISTGNKYELHLINYTDLDLLAAVYRKEGKLKYAGLSSGLIKSRSSRSITSFSYDSLSSFNDLFCQIIRFQRQAEALKPPIERHIRLGKLLDKKAPENAPVLERNMWLNQLDDPQELPAPHTQTRENVEKKEEVPENLVDLHAEVLGLDTTTMSAADILIEQISVFNKYLDKAIVYGLDEIIFVHGLGQGVLRKKILTEIRNRKEIKYWEDAQKEKFGYGATKIVIK